MTVVALVGAVVFAVGYLSPFGIEWVATLTVKDVLAMTWLALPAGVIGMAFGRFIGIGSHKLVPDAVKQKVADKYPKVAIAGLIGKLVFGLAGTIGPLFGGLYITLTPENAFQIIPPLSLLHIVAVRVLFETFSEEAQNDARLGGLIYSAAVCVLITGTLQGYSKAGATPRYLAQTEARTWCATLVAGGERGALLYDRTKHAMALVRWDSLKSLERVEKCSVPAANTAVKAVPSGPAK